MGFKVGNIDLGLDVNQRSFNRQLSGISRGAERSVSSAFKGLGSKIGVVLGGAAIISFTKSCLGLGSNLTEVQNVVDTTFTSMSASVNKFAKNAMEQFGLSETVAKKYMGTLGTMTKSMGFSESTAYDMAEAITGLTADVASFYNLSSDEAFTKLKSIWTGETESLKDLGVLLTQANLDQYALSKGYRKTTSQMSEQEKLMLRYEYTMSALGAAQGDFAKTSGSWANQVRVLSLRFDSLKATLGQGFINLFTPILKSINNLIERLQVLADKFKSFTETITGSSGDIASTMSNAAASANEMESSTDATASAAKAIKKQLAGIDEVNILSNEASNSSIADDISSASMNNNAMAIADAGEKSVKSETAIERFFKKFKEGFDSLGKVDTSGLMTSMTNVKKQIEGIFTDVDVVSAFQKNFDEQAVTTGKLGGLVKNFGTKVAEMYTETIEKFLDENAPWVKEKIVDFLDISTENNKIVQKFTDDLNWIVDNIDWDTMSDIGADVLEMFKPQIEILQKVYEWISKIASKMVDSFGNTKVVLVLLFNAALQKVKDKLDEVKKNIVFFGRTVKKIFSGDISGALEDIKAAFKEKFDKVKNSIDGVKNKVKEIFDATTGFFAVKLNEFLTWLDKFVPGIKDAFFNTFKNIKTAISNKMNEIKGNVSGSLDDAKSAWGTKLQSIKDKFDVKFTAIKTTVVSIVKSMWSGIKTVINKIIGGFEGFANAGVKGVNKILEAFNKLKIDLPDWASDASGMGSIGFNIPYVPEVTIPRLAQGGYAKANTPQLAMIGDNRHQGEVVAPEGKLQEMALTAAKMSNSGDNREAVRLLKELITTIKNLDGDTVFNVDSEELARAAKRGQNKLNRRMGTLQFN